MASIIQFNGEDIASPLPFPVLISDQDQNSDADSNGTLHRNRVCVKRKISLEWGPLAWGDISKILTLTEDIYFNCRYPDPKTMKFETKQFYVGDRTAPICVVQDGGDVMWEGLTMDIVER